MGLKNILLTLLLFVVSVLGIFAVRLFLFYTVAPDCRISVRAGEQGMRILVVEPNFVVNSVYGVTITESNGTEHSLVPLPNIKREFVLPSNVVSGSKIQISCELQYDRIAPSITTVTKAVSVP